MAANLPAGFVFEDEDPATAPPAADAVPPVDVAEGGEATLPAVDSEEIPAGFELPNAAPAEPQRPEQLSPDEFAAQLYQRLSNPSGGNAEDILAWSRSVGHPIVDNDDFRENMRIAEENRRTAGLEAPRPYGRHVESDDPSTYLSAGDLGAWFRGVGSVVPFADEIAAAATTGDLGGQDYQRQWERYNAQRNVDRMVNPTANYLGEGTGVAMSALIPFGTSVRGGSFLGNTARVTGTGALEGAIYGTDAGSPNDRFEHTGSGALFGGAAATAAPWITRALGGLYRRGADFIGSRIGREGTDVGVIANRLNLDPAELQQELSRLQQNGITPAPYDLLGEAGQDMVGSLARRNTPGRGRYQRFADEARVGLPDRVRERADIISPETRTPDEIVETTNRARDDAMDAAMEPIRGTPVPLADDAPIWEVLRTSEGRTAARAAARLERDPETKRQLLQLAEPPVRPEGADEIEALHQQVRDLGLPPEAEARALAQLPPIPEAEPRVMTVDMADKISRAFIDAADTAGRNNARGRARVLRGYGREVRDTAADAVPEYRAALDNYGEASRASDAVRVGEDAFDTGTTDRFVRQVEDVRASDTERRTAERRTEEERRGVGEPQQRGTPEPRSYSDLPVGSPEEVAAARDRWRRFPYHSDAIVNTPQGRGTIFASSVDNVAEGVPASGDVIVKLDTGEVQHFPAEQVRSAWDRPRLQEVTPQTADTFTPNPQASEEGRAQVLRDYEEARAARPDLTFEEWRAEQLNPNNPVPVGGERLPTEEQGDALGEAMRFRAAQRRQGERRQPPVEGAPRRGPNEQNMRAGVRREFERRAGESVRGAYDLAERVALRNGEQGRRLQAALGPEDANTLQNALGAELEVTRGRIRNAPRTGTRTALNEQDDAVFADIVGSAVGGGKVGFWRGVARAVKEMGISDRAAERIVNIMTDTSPEATERVIRLLERQLNGNRRRAEYITRTIRASQIRQSERDLPEPE